MDKLDSLSIPMIMGDWMLVIEAVKMKLAQYKDMDINKLNEDEAAEICEDIDRLEGILAHLKIAFKMEYGK